MGDAIHGSPFFVCPINRSKWRIFRRAYRFSVWDATRGLCKMLKNVSFLIKRIDKFAKGCYNKAYPNQKMGKFSERKESK